MNPALRVLGTIGLGVTAFDLGWKIGSGINAKFLKIGIPEGGTTAGGYGNRTGVSLAFRTAGYDLQYGATTDEDGFVWQFKLDGNNTVYERWFQGQCPFTFPAAPPPFQTRSSSTSTSTCYVAPNTYSVNPVYYGFVPENGLADALNASGPVEDYTNQPYGAQSAEPDDPGRAAVKERLVSELRTSKYPTANQWYDYLFDEPDACDPVDPSHCNPPEDDPDEDCDLSPHATAPPDPAVDAFAVKQAFVRVNDDGLVKQTALRWGVARNVASSGQPAWAGWGYRKIALKHGWDTADALATQVALAQRPASPDGTTYVYDGPDYAGRNGAVCLRRVVVETYQRSYETAAREIITSYGRNVARG